MPLPSIIVSVEYRLALLESYVLFLYSNYLQNSAGDLNIAGILRSVRLAHGGTIENSLCNWSTTWYSQPHRLARRHCRAPLPVSKTPNILTSCRTCSFLLTMHIVGGGHRARHTIWFKVLNQKTLLLLLITLHESRPCHRTEDDSTA